MTTHSVNMVLLENKYGYVFDPETMYQPAVPDIEYFDDGMCRFFPDGRVETLDPDWELEQGTFKGWNNYSQAGGGFRAYVKAAKQFWPHRPKELTAIDHINRDRSDDSWSNLRLCSTSLNNLNQYRRGTKGYRYETSEWLEKVNASRAKSGKPRYTYVGHRGTSTSLCLPIEGSRWNLENLIPPARRPSVMSLLRNPSYRMSLDVYGLNFFLPRDIARLCLEYSNHVRKTPGGVAFVIYF